YFFLINETNMSIHAAAAQIKLPQNTAQGWTEKSEQVNDGEMEIRETGSMSIGRPRKL
ncbi:hypothetical protein BD770DRAFT_312639, partial [Pilaira anomala]